MKEDDGEPDDGVATQNLSGPDDHVDLGSTTVDTSEAFGVGGTGRLFVLETDRVDDTGQSALDILLVGLAFVLASESPKTGSSLLYLADPA